MVQGAIAQAEVAAVAWWLERGPARARWRQSVQVRIGDLSDAEIQAALDEVAQRLAGAGGAAACDEE